MICVRQIKNHTQAIKQSVLLIENIRMLIEYNNLSLKEIFENISKKDTYNLLEFLNTINYGNVIITTIIKILCCAVFH